MSDAARMRASDAEREQAADALREHHAAGPLNAQRARHRRYRRPRQLP